MGGRHRGVAGRDRSGCGRGPGAAPDDIRFAHDNIRRFALAQKATIGECQIEVVPGLIAGQKQIPVEAAGCYVPGGRYSHIAAALMTVTTARAAAVGHVTACSPPRPVIGIHPAILYTSTSTSPTRCSTSAACKASPRWRSACSACRRLVR